jgi:hypothetical protein
VTWGDTYDSVYSGDAPQFLGDSSAALAAATALRTALIDDPEFDYIVATSYLAVPKSIDVQKFVVSHAVYLHTPGLSLAEVNSYSYDASPTLGYTTWQLVPQPATIWLFGAALGLLAWLNRRTT